MRYLLLLLLAGCATNPNLNTPSPIYTTHFIGSQPNQSQVNECVEAGKAVGWEWAGRASSGFDITRAGNAYEACMKRKGYTAK